MEPTGKSRGRWMDQHPVLEDTLREEDHKKSVTEEN